jgi:hypothetical protein
VPFQKDSGLPRGMQINESFYEAACCQAPFLLKTWVHSFSH